jgi:hypothetical protein
MHELVNAKVLALIYVGGTVGTSLYTCIPLISAKVDTRGDAGGLWCE